MECGTSSPRVYKKRTALSLSCALGKGRLLHAGRSESGMAQTESKSRGLIFLAQELVRVPDFLSCTGLSVIRVESLYKVVR